jgi:altronate dehydratase
MRPDHIRLSPEDDVAIALSELPAGASIAGITLTMPVPRGHKIALHPIAAGAPVRRYGQIIGQAGCDIAAGEHVHVQNLGMSRHALDHVFDADLRPLPAPAEARTFQGYRRADARTTIWGC